MFNYILLGAVLVCYNHQYCRNIMHYRKKNPIYNIKNPGITRAVYSGVLIMLLAIITAVTFKKYLSYIQSFSVLLIIGGISLLLMTSD